MKNRNKIVIVLSVIFAIISLIFVILGFALSGADILAWFTSKWAWYFYTIGIVYILVVVAIFVADWIKRM